MDKKPKEQHVVVSGIVAQRDFKPYVVLETTDRRTQLTVADARKIAHDLVIAASRYEADAMMIQFGKEQGWPDGAIAAIMVAFREFRMELDAEPVEGYYTDPEDTARKI